MKFLVLILVLLIILSFPRVVVAHPIDEIGDIKVYDQQQNIEVSPHNIKLVIDLKFYAYEKIKVWESIDSNKDQKLSEEEKNIWMKKGQEASWIELDGERYGFAATSVRIPDYYEFFSKKPAEIQIDFLLETKISPNQKFLYHYQGKDKKLEEIEVTARGTAGLKVASLEKVDPNSVLLSIVAGNESGAAVLGISTGDRINNFLNRFVKQESLPPNLIILSLVSAFVLGALHALTPGHGKALVAGYLIGEKGTVANAVQLGLIITLTHTASVFILGLLALLLTAYIVPSEVVKWLNKASGALIVAFGLFLLYQRGKKIRNSGAGRIHSHDYPHDHPASNSISFRRLLPLGISGGIVPCVDALAILVVAVSLEKILFGLFLIAIFSLGLAAALIAAGVVVVVAKNKAAQKIQRFSYLERYLGLVSATIVTILGFLLLSYK